MQVAVEELTSQMEGIKADIAEAKEAITAQLQQAHASTLVELRQVKLPLGLPDPLRGFWVDNFNTDSVPWVSAGASC